MSRAAFAFLFVSGLWAQTPTDPFDKAPPEVDEALRQRITAFYQAHVDKKFRQADQYVAEDTKDFYYEQNKPAYLGFEIQTITYSDNFTKAKAIIKCKMFVNMPGFADMPAVVPTPSTWKVENGQWFWYVDQSVGRETPFGRMKPAEGVTPGRRLPTVPAAPDVLRSMWDSVRADKNKVELSAKRESSDEVTILNKMPGEISLRLDYPKTPGLEVSLDRAELKSGEQARISLRSLPLENSPARTAEIHVVVQPTNQVIPIVVAIQ